MANHDQVNEIRDLPVLARGHAPEGDKCLVVEAHLHAVDALVVGHGQEEKSPRASSPAGNGLNFLESLPPATEKDPPGANREGIGITEPGGSVSSDREEEVTKGLNTAAGVHEARANAPAEAEPHFQPVGTLLAEWTRAWELRADAGAPAHVGTVLRDDAPPSDSELTLQPVSLRREVVRADAIDAGQKETPPGRRKVF